jgi:hypothetical protein
MEEENKQEGQAPPRPKTTALQVENVDPESAGKCLEGHVYATARFIGDKMMELWVADFIQDIREVNRLLSVKPGELVSWKKPD